MEPRVTKGERKLHLAYDLPHRVHCARIYPVQCQNGSTLVIYGHGQGVKILYRGGRRPQVNSRGTDYEDEEDETDPDAPYPNFIQEMDLDLGSTVLHVATPAPPSQASQSPAVAKNHAIVAVHTADKKISVLQIPLAPCSIRNSRDVVDAILARKIDLPAGGTMVNDISIKISTRFRSGISQLQTEAEHTVCVAVVSDVLKLWRLDANGEEIIDDETTRFQKLPLPSKATKVSYHPSTSSTKTLLADAQGSVRIYDSSAPRDPNFRPTSSDSMSTSIDGDEVGKWVMTFQAPFHALSQEQPAVPARKVILDAKWILGGRAILALLQDGEWGVWDVSATAQNNKSVEEFTLHGYLGSAATAATDTGKQRRGSSKLAPMTPNTRKTKSQNFFSGASKAPGAVSKGGICVTGNDTLTGQTDESVMLWYEGEVYAIPNVQQFWQRSLNVSNSGAGSLYAPGLSHIPDVNMINENITSISQFSAKSSSSGLGQMNTPRDFLVSAEHRFIIHQATRPPVPSKSLFERVAATAAPAAASTDRDQRMLNAGELDIGGMDRMLDSMAGGAARTRRVGFAAS
jgi:hypothetical protein